MKKLLYLLLILCLPFYAQKGGGKKSEDKSPLEKLT